MLQDRGLAFRNLRELLLEEEASRGGNRSLWSSEGPMLSICTTRCSDGDIELFSFGPDDGAANNDGHHKKEPKPHERLLKAVEASCRTPRSFHPVDMVALHYNEWMRKLPHTRDTYPAEEGISINGDDNGYVDGGIAAPFPPTPLDGIPLASGGSWSARLPASTVTRRRQRMSNSGRCSRRFGRPTIRRHGGRRTSIR